MLVQTSGEPYYARGILGKPGDTDRIARQHLTGFWRWKVPVVEGRATAQGHTVDADEVSEMFEEMDAVGQHEPEAQGGLVAAQHGELLVEEIHESPCIRCPNIWCQGDIEEVCRVFAGADEMFLVATDEWRLAM